MSEHDLLTRLTGLRRRARLLAVTYGLLTVVVSASATFLAVGVLDFLLDLPSLLRFLMALSFVAASAWLLRRMVWRPATRRITLDDIAQRIERHFDGLNDRLASTVNFLQTEGGGSSALVRQVVAETTGLTRALPLQNVLTSRPAWRTFGLTIVMLLLLAGVNTAAPGFSLTGLKRFANPFGSTEWPKRVEIEPISGDVKVPLGASFTAEMRLKRGRRDGLRAWVHTLDDQGRRRRDLLRFDPAENVYRRTYDGLAGSFEYWFEAGDDQAPDDPARVTVVHRPAVVRASLEVTPPSYVSVGGPVELPLDDRVVTVLKGSRAEMRVETSKPIAPASSGSDAESPAALLFGAGRTVSLAATDESRQQLLGTFAVTDSDTFEIRLIGVDGFENRDRSPYQLVARADETPVVVIVEPQSVLEVTPNASVSMLIDADDDYGLNTLRLTYRIESTETEADYDLTDRLDVRESGGRYVTQVRYAWPLKPLGLKPGDLVQYRAEVTDNFVLDGERHDPSFSPTMRLKVVSEAEFAARLRDEFKLLAGRLRQVLSRQETLRDEIEALAADAGEQGKVLSEADRDALDQIGSRQGSAATRTDQLSGQFKRLSRRMAMNNVQDAESRRRADRAAEQLTRISAEPMAEARRSIQQARQAEQADRQRAALGKTSDHQQAAIDALERLIEQMNRWGDFHEVVERTRDLLDRQQRVRRQTRRVAKETLGKPVEQLSDEESKALRRTARDQSRLAEDAERLMEQMEEVARASARRSPAETDLLRQSVRKARAAGVSKRMKRAAAAVEENRGGQAGREQEAAEAALQDVLDQLEQRQTRELAALAKRLEEADEAIRLLLEQQTKLRDDNLAARGQGNAGELVRGLAAVQSGLERNTQQLARELGGRERLAQVSRTVARAATRMAQAAAKLGESFSEPAETHQTAAIEQLEEALRQLAALKRRTEQQLAQRALAEIRKDLQAIRDKQATIKTNTSAMIERIGESGRLSRAEVRRLRHLSAAQEQLIETVRVVRKEIESAVVYDWVMRRVAERMGDVRERFDDRRVDDETIELQDEVLTRLDRLIEASKEDARPDEDESNFASGGGGGQGAQAGRANPVPGVAQLKVLKMMQLEINERTETLDKTIDPTTAGEAELQQLKDLGSEQKQVRELLEDMVARSRPGG